MNDDRTPGERLDALLTALEDEVLRLDQSGRQLVDESIGTEDIGAIRARMESMIHARTGDPGRRPEPLHGVGDGAGAKVSVVQVMQRLGRWAEAVQGGGAGGAVPEARMAFSGESSERPGKIARKTTRRERDGSDDGEHRDC